MKKQNPSVCSICPPAFVKMFLAGLLLGAAVIWVVWRRKNLLSHDPAHRAAPSHGQEIDITVPVHLHPDTTPLVKESPKAASPVKPPVVETASADFTVIKGIGPVYAQRLQEAGITTFAALAKQPSQRLRDIVRAKDWQALDIDSWIAHARQLAS